MTAALAQLGARVVVADIADEAGQETAALIRSAGGTAAFVHTDVSREADVSRLVMWTLADFGPAGLLINNAIVSRGADLTCRAFLPGMQLSGSGRIINMVSTDAMAHMSAYTASKQGVAGFTQSLAAEVGHQGVQVVAFAPGFVDTPGLRAAGEKLAPRLGMEAEAFARLSFHPAYEGMRPSAHAGAATAYLATRLMADYHGEVVTGYTVLERAGFLPTQAVAAAPAGAPKAAGSDALDLCRRLEALLAETEAEFGRLPPFVRPLACSGFKAKAGLSLQE